MSIELCQYFQLYNYTTRQKRQRNININVQCTMTKIIKTDVLNLYCFIKKIEQDSNNNSLQSSLYQNQMD